MNQQNPLVSISCITYNHAPYIRQCLDSFLMQKTDFAFEVLIHDDCSTDGTTEIIKEYEAKYPDIIKPMYEEENQYQQGKPAGSAIWNFPRAKGKYIALCEGDDYWTDSFKLQNQVDFLEANKEYVLSHTSFSYQIEYENNRIKDSVIETDRNIEIQRNDLSNIIEHILDYNHYRIQTATVVYRSDTYNKIQLEREKENEPSFLMGDTQLWVRLCQHGKIHFSKDNTAIYRLNKGSACRPTSEIKRLRFALSCAEMRLYYARLYNIKETYLRKFLNDYKKHIFRYKLIDKEYKPIINTNEIIFDKILLSSTFLSIVKPLYKIYNSSIMKRFRP